MQRFLVPLFTFFWWKRLDYDWTVPYYADPVTQPVTCKSQVIKVKGWRTALVDAPSRKTVTFIPKWVLWLK